MATASIKGFSFTSGKIANLTKTDSSSSTIYWQETCVPGDVIKVSYAYTINSIGSSDTTGLRCVGISFYDSGLVLLSSPITINNIEDSIWFYGEFSATAPTNAAYVRILSESNVAGPIIDLTLAGLFGFKNGNIFSGDLNGANYLFTPFVIGTNWSILDSSIYYGDDGTITADSYFSSSLATGTAPISVSSTSIVKNLNTRYLQGKSVTDGEIPINNNVLQTGLNAVFLNGRSKQEFLGNMGYVIDYGFNLMGIDPTGLSASYGKKYLAIEDGTILTPTSQGWIELYGMQYSPNSFISVSSPPLYGFFYGEELYYDATTSIPSGRKVLFSTNTLSYFGRTHFLQCTWINGNSDPSYQTGLNSMLDLYTFGEITYSTRVDTIARFSKTSFSSLTNSVSTMFYYIKVYLYRGATASTTTNGTSCYQARIGLNSYTKGFLAGGSRYVTTGSAVYNNEIDYFSFSNNTSGNVYASTLAATKAYSGAISFFDFGLSIAGSNGTGLNSIEKISFNNDSVSTVGSSAVSGVSQAFNSTTDGYYCLNNNTSSVPLYKIAKSTLTFDTVVATISANATYGTTIAPWCNSATKGYTFDKTAVSNIYKQTTFTWSSNTLATDGATQTYGVSNYRKHPLAQQSGSL